MKTRNKMMICSAALLLASGVAGAEFLDDGTVTQDTYNSPTVATFDERTIVADNDSSANFQQSRSHWYSRMADRMHLRHDKARALPDRVVEPADYYRIPPNLD